jgi:hypothetical protein
MIENGFIYAGVVFGILTVMIGALLVVVMRATDAEGKRPGEH